MEKLIIRLIETDSLDEDNNYYLYEVESNSAHYYVARSDEDKTKFNEQEQKNFWAEEHLDFSNEFEMLDRNQFTDREWEIAKYLFMFLWDSSNGTNTGCDQDIYEEDGFTYEEMLNFIDKFGFDTKGVLEIDTYDEGSIEIYWSYFSCFNLKTCNVFEDREGRGW